MLKSKLTFILITLIVCSISFGLANYFGKNSLSLPPVVDQAIAWVESLFDKQRQHETIAQSADQKLANEPSTKVKPQQYKHIEAGKAPVCVDTSLGKVKYKKVGGVYHWIDEKGIANYSDTPPNTGDYETLNFAGEKVLDYFSLELNTASLPYDFHQELTLKLNKLFAMYGKLLDSSSLKKAAINLQVIADKYTYQQILQKHNFPAGTQTNGFYSHGANKAYLLFTDKNRTMQTAVHEATHAINRAVIGYTPKWLNEGLAEYSETIKVNGKSVRVYANTNWTANNKLNQELLSLKVLFSATKQDWSGKLRQRLYATSWAFIYFMMEKPTTKNMLARVINAEQENICDTLKFERIEGLLAIDINTLQRQFFAWSKAKIKAQVI